MLRNYTYFTAVVLAVILVSCGKRLTEVADDTRPNIIVVFTDDEGYADVASYGAKFATPHLDRMAEEGVRFTNFYVGQPVCSASRAALLTGCYPGRVSVHGALGPGAKTGLNPEEETLAELCKARGYKTFMVGKWHLGDHPDLLPVKQGFDGYLGLPYSNDMWPGHPDNAKRNYPRLPLLQDDSVLEYLDEHQNMLTTRYTARAVKFIEENRDNPFFLYVAHSMPHVPLFVSDKFRGKSGHGLYGDVIAEIDWSVGEILSTLKRLDIDKNTLVIFTSDNGPWLSYGKHAGSALPLREGKGTVFEGGVRVPCIMRWPGKIPEGSVQHEPAMTIDILPTIASLIGTELPKKPIDGKNIWPLIANERGAVSPHQAYYFYYRRNELQGMRSGKWKLYFPHTYTSFEGLSGRDDGMPTAYAMKQIGLELYDLENDVSEKLNVAGQYPGLVDSLQQMADAFRAKLGDSLTGVEGADVRPAATVQAFK